MPRSVRAWILSTSAPSWADWKNTVAKPSFRASARMSCSRSLERGAAVDTRLALAEAVEVGAVEDGDFHQESILTTKFTKGTKRKHGTEARLREVCVRSGESKRVVGFDEFPGQVEFLASSAARAFTPWTSVA
jgi:hypothetical protein